MVACVNTVVTHLAMDRPRWAVGLACVAVFAADTMDNNKQNMECTDKKIGRTKPRPREDHEVVAALVHRLTVKWPDRAGQDPSRAARCLGLSKPIYPKKKPSQ